MALVGVAGPGSRTLWFPHVPLPALAEQASGAMAGMAGTAGTAGTEPAGCLLGGLLAGPVQRETGSTAAVIPQILRAWKCPREGWSLGKGRSEGREGGA